MYLFLFIVAAMVVANFPWLFMLFLGLMHQIFVPLIIFLGFLAFLGAFISTNERQ